MLLAQSNRKASRLQLHHSPQAAMADKKRKTPPATDAYFYRTSQAGEMHYRCNICKVCVRGIVEARDHVKDHGAILEDNLRVSRRNAAPGRTSCNRCGRNYPDTPYGRAKLSKHQVCCGDTETVCSRCGDNFKKPQWLRSHMAQNPRCVEKKEADERILMGREDRPA